jgi:hypothetical protein
MSQSYEMLSRQSTHGIFLGFNIKRKKMTLLKKILLDTICWTWSIFQILIHIFITNDSETHSLHFHKFFEPWTFNFHNGTCPCLEFVINLACTICYGWCSNRVINELLSPMFKLPFKDTTCFIGFGHNGKNKLSQT